MLSLLAEAAVLDTGLKIRTLTLPDVFQDQDKPDRLYATAGPDAKAIFAKATEALGPGARVASLRG